MHRCLHLVTNEVILNILASFTCAWYPHIPRMVTSLLKVIGTGQDGGLWPTAAQVVQEDGSTSTSECSHSECSGVCSHRRAYIGLHHCAQHTYTLLLTSVGKPQLSAYHCGIICTKASITYGAPCIVETQLHPPIQCTGPTPKPQETITAVSCSCWGGWKKKKDFAYK